MVWLLKRGKKRKGIKKSGKRTEKEKQLFFWNRIFRRIDRLQICDGWSQLTVDFVDSQDLKKKEEWAKLLSAADWTVHWSICRE